jgi:hypothetical protein
LGGGEEEAHRKNELRGDVRSARGEWRWGQRLEVVVNSSRCGKVVHGGAVLGAVTGSSEGAGAALCGGSMVVAEISGTEGVMGRGRRKEAPRWGVSTLYSRQRWWMRRRKQWAVRQWAVRRWPRCRGRGKVVASAV